uniref:hypothetical protein n=1 Tax=Alistipes sp. D31t1_170403_E11 TaxID=2787128 RepID=UPI001899BABD|nr:hypothetical protein [Alistipes sp. D31t1_170403_E11]
MQRQTIRSLRKGEFFRLTDSDTAPVWVRGEYSREARKYSTHKFYDINHEQQLPGDRLVYVGFTF